MSGIGFLVLYLAAAILTPALLVIYSFRPRSCPLCGTRMHRNNADRWDECPRCHFTIRT